MAGAALAVLTLCVLVEAVLLAWVLREARDERTQLLSRIQAPDLAARMLVTDTETTESAPLETDIPEMQYIGKVYHDGVGGVNED